MRFNWSQRAFFFDQGLMAFEASVFVSSARDAGTVHAELLVSNNGRTIAIGDANETGDFSAPYRSIHVGMDRFLEAIATAASVAEQRRSDAPVEEEPRVYEWEHRAFLTEEGLGACAFEVVALAPSRHPQLGVGPAAVCADIELSDGCDAIAISTSFDVDEGPAETVAAFSRFREALTAMLGAIGEASEVVKEHWEAEEKGKSE